MATRALPIDTHAFVSKDSGKPSKDFFNWARSLTDKVNNQAFIDARDYGAKDGFDSTAALQAAGQDAIKYNLPLGILGSTNGYIVSQNGSNSYCLQFTAPLKIFGHPGYSIIRPADTLAGTVDIIQLVGNASGYQQAVIDGIMIGNPSAGTRKGRHALVFNTLSANQIFLRPLITNNFLQDTGVDGNFSIQVNNSAVNNPNGGFAYGVIHRNYIGSGITLNSAGDSIEVSHNNLSGTTTNDGLYANLVSGAGNLQFIYNNFGANGTALAIDAADTFYCAGNELEHNNTGSTNALINIAGTVARVTGGSIVGNELTILGGSANHPLCLAIDKVDYTNVDDNTFQTFTAYTPWTISANAGTAASNAGIIVGANNKFPTSSTLKLTDSAASTRYTNKTTLHGHTTHASTIAAGTTAYAMNDISTSEPAIYFRCPYPSCIIKNLEVYFGNGAPGAGQSYTCTLMKNGSPTSVTCTVSGAGVNSNQDITHQASYSQGDQFSIRIVTSAGAALVQDFQWTMDVCQV